MSHGTSGITQEMKRSAFPLLFCLYLSHASEHIEKSKSELNKTVKRLSDPDGSGKAATEVDRQPPVDDSLMNAIDVPDIDLNLTSSTLAERCKFKDTNSVRGSNWNEFVSSYQYCLELAVLGSNTDMVTELLKRSNDWLVSAGHAKLFKACDSSALLYAVGQSNKTVLGALLASPRVDQALILELLEASTLTDPEIAKMLLKDVHLGTKVKIPLSQFILNNQEQVALAVIEDPRASFTPNLLYKSLDLGFEELSIQLLSKLKLRAEELLKCLYSTITLKMRRPKVFQYILKTYLDLFPDIDILNNFWENDMERDYFIPFILHPNVPNKQALPIAVRLGWLKSVRLLLGIVDGITGAKAQASSSDLIEACTFGHLKVAKCLIRLPGIDPGAKNNLALLRTSVNGHTDIMALLLSYPRVRNHRFTPGAVFACDKAVPLLLNAKLPAHVRKAGLESMCLAGHPTYIEALLRTVPEVSEEDLHAILLKVNSSHSLGLEAKKAVVEILLKDRQLADAVYFGILEAFMKEFDKGLPQAREILQERFQDYLPFVDFDKNFPLDINRHQIQYLLCHLIKGRHYDIHSKGKSLRMWVHDEVDSTKYPRAKDAMGSYAAFESDDYL